MPPGLFGLGQLVSDDVVAIGIWNLLYRHVRCRAGFLGGFWFEDTIQYFWGLSVVETNHVSP